jgi:type VI secretion system protein ImpH
LLQRYLGVPVDVDSFVGRWYRIPQEGRTHLGGGLGQGGGVLGRSAVVGERVWQRNLRMRLTLGPLDHARFRRFLPGGPGERALRHWLGLLIGPSLEFEVRLRLRQSDVCPVTLGGGADREAGRLGWDTFLLTAPAQSDREDVRYDIQAVA